MSIAVLDRYLNGAYDPSTKPWYSFASRVMAWIFAVVIMFPLGAATYSHSIPAKMLKDPDGPFGWHMMETVAIFSALLFCFAGSMFLAAYLIDVKKWRPQFVSLLGMTLTGGGYVFVSFMGVESFWVHFSGFIITGIGVGLVYGLPIKMAASWWPDKKGAATGSSVLGFGGGADVLILVMYSLTIAGVTIGGNTLGFGEGYSDAERIAGMQDTFLYFGLAIIAIGIVSMPWVKFAPAGYYPAGKAKPKQESTDLTQMTLKEAWQTRQMWLLWPSFLFNAGSVLMVIGLAVSYIDWRVPGMTLFLLEASAVGATALLFLLVMNALGRQFYGWVADQTSAKSAMLFMTIVQAGIIAAFPHVHSDVGLVLLAGFAGFQFGGNFTLYPLMTQRLFGIKNLLWTYSGTFSAYGVGGVVMPLYSTFCLSLLTDTEVYLQTLQQAGESYLMWLRSVFDTIAVASWLQVVADWLVLICYAPVQLFLGVAAVISENPEAWAFYGPASGLLLGFLMVWFIKESATDLKSQLNRVELRAQYSEA